MQKVLVSVLVVRPCSEAEAGLEGAPCSSSLLHSLNALHVPLKKTRKKKPFQIVRSYRRQAPFSNRAAPCRSVLLSREAG